MEFKKTTATQRIIELNKKIRAVSGGTSASKTISIILYLITRAQMDKEKTLTSIISESTPHLKRGALRDFKNIMQFHNYWKSSRWQATDSIYTFETGSQIEFFSADQADKLRGGRRDRAFLNEANNLTLDAFDQIEVRTKDFVFLDWNPTNEFWFYTEVMGKREDVDFITLTYKDNEALSQEIIDSIESRKNRKGWWKVYGLGQLGEVEGKIFKGWEIIDEIPHEAKLVRFGLDFGYSNDPTSIVAIYYYNGGYIIDEITFLKGLSNKQIADIIKNQESSELVIADSAEPKSIDEIKSYGVNITGVRKRAEGNIKSFVKWRIGIVQDKKISVTKRSYNVINEYRNYLWETDKQGKILNTPEHTFSHCLKGETKVKLANGRDKQIKNIKVGDVVKTEKGEHKVLVSQLNKKLARVYEIKLSNGSKLVGTGNHKIYTHRGKVAIDSLRYDDRIKVLETNKISLWKKQSHSIIKNISGTVDTITEKLDYTRQFGSILMVKSQKGTTYTTRTAIDEITKSLTLNLKLLKTIYQNTQKKCGNEKDLKRKCQTISKILENLQKNGTLLRKELNGTVNTEKKLGLIEKYLKRIAKFVEKNMKHIFPTEADFAITIVGRKNFGKEDVYNLTIDKEHNYYANDILVGNSMDAICYAFVSLFAIPAQSQEEIRRIQQIRYNRVTSNDTGL